ncbi:hypothetical protein A2160_05050 [Candidatus Beckwithbacteria bacterium RBG_13_42_9]|uniref:Deoxynucleoside kinase domain-containing protein n=1 Tax=Candidatus Beckwithbacteria bacterium RBG_13_42_9 TaxID=1797457 RepID=A0A1F5E837_9BACT|nr:MAG: hypothetical protein A2160_05050 [Candidatus Beckwithbacteria bacterium RBG_13_42_9]
MKKTFYLSVAGILGVGKTTVAKLLTERLGTQILEENFAENQFLPRFYQDMRRWAFHSQTFFLLEKVKQTFQSKKILASGQSVVQDTPIIQDVQSYAKAQYILGNMDEAEFNLYTKTYSLFVKRLPQPNLIIYLEASWETVLKRQASRGREFEKQIPKDYLELLEKLNRQWVRKYDHRKILRIKTDHLDFVNNGTDKKELVEKVLQKLVPVSTGIQINGWGEKLKSSQVILMCGLPGSGKSSLAEKLGQTLGYKIISSDKIRERVFKSSRFDPAGDEHVRSLKPRYYSLLFEEVKKIVLGGEKIIVDASNLSRERPALIDKISQLIPREKMTILTVRTPKEVIAKRMEKAQGPRTKKESFFQAWQRVYGFFEKYLQDGEYSWPTKSEGVRIIEIKN